MKRCKDCDKPIKFPKKNKSGYCTACYTRKSTKTSQSMKKRKNALRLSEIKREAHV